MTLRRSLPSPGLGLLTAGALLLGSTLPLYAAGPGGPAGPAPVAAFDAKAADLALTTRLPGRVKASEVAEVRPQVSGIIRERLFTEGSKVKMGDAIFRIEDDEYRAAVEAAKAAVNQARANFELTKIEEKRASELFASNAGTAQKRDSATATRQAAEAGLQAAEANLRMAEINLDRTVVRAPISGVIGLSQTTIGALVGAQQPLPLATIRNLDRVYVDVTQSAVDLLRWTANDESRAITQSGEVALILADGSTHGNAGRLEAAEPQVEPTTGMITLRLVYDNAAHRLLPGMYVEVDLPQAMAENAVAVPQNAVMRDRSGAASVWVIDNGAVAVRPVEIATSSGNQWIVTEGLKDGDVVITSGFQKIGPGAPVARVPAPGAGAAPAASAPKAD